MSLPSGFFDFEEVMSSPTFIHELFLEQGKVGHDDFWDSCFPPLWLDEDPQLYSQPDLGVIAEPVDKVEVKVKAPCKSSSASMMFHPFASLEKAETTVRQLRKAFAVGRKVMTDAMNECF
jgi:hypothetical protein